MALTPEQKELKGKILEVLDRTDTIGMHAIGRALVHLLNRQTVEEQSIEQTREWNQKGFNGYDGHLGTSMAKFYESQGYLTEKQLAIWRRPCKKGSNVSAIQKYWKQLLEEAERKNG